MKRIDINGWRFWYYGNAFAVASVKGSAGCSLTWCGDPGWYENGATPKAQAGF